MTTNHIPPDTSCYEAWIVAETRAAEAQRRLRETGFGTRKGRLETADAELAARVTELQHTAASLFERAMEEMNGAVEAALSKTHSRHH